MVRFRDDRLELAAAWVDLAEAALLPWVMVVGKKRSKRLVMDTLRDMDGAPVLAPNPVGDITQGPLLGLKAALGSAGVGTVLWNVSFKRDRSDGPEWRAVDPSASSGLKHHRPKHEPAPLPIERVPSGHPRREPAIKGLRWSGI